MSELPNDPVKDSTPSKIRILIADDHAIVRAGLKSLLESDERFAVVGESDDGLETIRLVEKLAPDVLILDLSMRGLHGLEVARQLGHREPKTRIVILSMHTTENYVLQALKNNVAAYVSKDSASAILIQAIDAAVAGKHYLPAPFSEAAITAYINQAGGDSHDAYDTLTTREREVLQLVAEGHTNAEIGSRLFISSRTVETHRAHLMQKLALKNEVDLVRYAFRKGLLPTDGTLPGEKSKESTGE